VRERLRSIRVLRSLRFLPYSLPYRAWSLIRPIRPHRILFLSDSHLGFTGNFGFLRAEIHRQQPDAEVVGIFKDGLGRRRSLRDLLRLPYLLATSAVVVLDDFYPLVYPLRLRRRTRLVQVWHAAGAFKRVGHSRAGLPGGPTPGSDIHRNYTHATVSSEGIRDDYAEAYGIPRERIRALGVPRSDFFFDEPLVTAARDRVRARLGVPASVRLAVYAPTFRGNGQLTAYADESADWGRVADALGGDWRVAVRRHPFTTRGARPLPAGVIDASADVEMNDLLAAADVLITDYSSAVFEFALLRRPVVFFTPDLDRYAATRSFYRPFEDYAIGPVVRSSEQLAPAISSAQVDSARFDRFLSDFCGALDGRSSERIVREVLLAAPRRSHPRRTDSASARLLRRAGLDLTTARVARVSLTVMSSLMQVLPSRRKVTMLTREHNRPPVDFVLLRDALRRRDPSMQVTIISRMVPGGVLPKVGYAFHILVELYHVATSRVLVVDGYSFVASAARHDDELTIVQMWHALGALKKFGLSILGRPEGRDPRLARAMRMHRNYDIVITSAERCRPAYAEAFGTDAAKVVVAPLPRVDRLRDPIARERARSRFAKLYPELGATPVVLYAPTFRTRRGSGHPVDPVELTRALGGAGYAVITKLHPLVAPPRHAELRTAPGMSTQDLMLVADHFVTDYSSAVFEAAVAGIPSYLLAPDLDDYVQSRDFYLTYPEDLGLPLTQSVAGLVDLLRAGAATPEQVVRLAEAFVETADDDRTGAADRLAELLIEAAGSRGRSRSRRRP